MHVQTAAVVTVVVHEFSSACLLICILRPFKLALACLLTTACMTPIMTEELTCTNNFWSVL